MSPERAFISRPRRRGRWPSPFPFYSVQRCPTAAAGRDDGNVLSLPGSLHGGAATKVVGTLHSCGLIREQVTDSPRKADAPLNTIWRNKDDGRGFRRCPTPSTRARTPLASRPRAPTRPRSRRPPSAGVGRESGAHGRDVALRARPATTPNQAQLIAMLRRK